MARRRPTAASIDWMTFRHCVRHLGTGDRERIREAFELGKESHAGQVRKSGEPYFSHCIAVANTLADAGADADTIIAALLHDAVEDTPLMLPEIERRFGKPVSALVGAATKLRSEDVAQSPTLDEKIETLRKMFTFMQEDVRIMVLKLVDRLHNMRTVEFLPEDRRQAVARETLDVYVKIADRLSMRDIREELEELVLAVLDRRELDQLLAIRRENEVTGRSVVERMRQLLNTSDPQHRKNVRVHYERKRFPQLRAQRDAAGAATTGVSSVTAVFVCDAVDTCYQVLGVLHGHWRRETLSFQDFINVPQINGYRGLHTTVILEDGTRVRCKIRTHEMEEYSHRGIAVKCFNQGARGLLEFLEWGARIAPLTRDTAERSKEFFASLQSDILGEAIVIHLPDDRTVLLPRGATALDGAFYGFSDLALRLKAVLVNGRRVAFQSPIANGDSLSVELARQPTVERGWLLHAQMGIAKAHIRSALAKAPRVRKVAEGRVLLQGVMTERRKGLIEEFREEGFLPGLKSLGLFSLDDAFIAIAEGQAEPAAVYAALFESQRKRDAANGRRRRYILRFSVRSGDIEARQRLLRAYYKYDESIRGVKNVHPPSSDLRSYRVVALLTPEECEEFRREIEGAGGRGVEVTLQLEGWGQRLAVSTIVLLWGLDPVVAHALLSGNISLFDLTFVRFLVFFIASAMLYATHHHFSDQGLKPISAFHPSLLLSGLALFITGIATYAALSFITPIQYILLIIAGGVTLASLLRAVRQGSSWFAPSVVLLVCLVSVWAIMHIQGTSFLGVLLGILSGISFGFYTEVSRRYQEEVAMVNARYPAYLLWLSVIALCLSFTVFPFTQLFSLPAITLLATAAFIFVFVFVPYALYYTLVRNIAATTLDRRLLFVCLATMVGEIVLTQSFSALLAIPVLLTLFWWEWVTSHATR